MREPCASLWGEQVPYSQLSTFDLRRLVACEEVGPNTAENGEFYDYAFRTSYAATLLKERGL